MLALLFASFLSEAAPVVHAATPSLDCVSACPNTTAGVSSGKITLTVTLTTASAAPLVIAVVSEGDTKAGRSTINTPTDNAASMNSLCAESSTIPGIAVYYFVGSSTSNKVIATISTTGTGVHGALIAFGVSGYATSGTFDISCPAAVTGTGTSPSATLSGLTNGNDFVFAGVASKTDTVKTSAPSTEISNTGTKIAAMGTAAAYQLGNGAGSYTLAFSTTSSSAKWIEVVAAVNDSSPTPVPLFPSGAAPLLLAIPVVYILLRRPASHKGEPGARK